MPKSKQSPDAPRDASQPASPPASGKGMPDKEERPQTDQSERQITPRDASVEANLELPNDRDQSTDMTPATPDPTVQQAAKDVKRGITDTSKGAETDKAYQKQK